MTPLMGEGDDEDAIRQLTVDDGAGESVEEHATSVALVRRS